MKSTSWLFNKSRYSIKQVASKLPALLFFLYLFPTSLNSQWKQIGSIGKPGTFFSLNTDSLTHSIFIGGDFEVLDSLDVPLYRYAKGKVKGLFKYNRLKVYPKWNSAVTGSCSIRDTLYFTIYGNLYHNDTIIHSRYLAFWINDTLYPAMDTTMYKKIVSSNSIAPYRYNDNLYFYLVLPRDIAPPGPITYSKVTNSFSGLGNGMKTNNGKYLYALNEMQEYKGKLYVGGNFYSGNILGDDHNFQVFDGENWSGIKGWQYPSGTIGDITSMAVFKGDLYIGGHFRKRDGGIADHIVRYDGQHFYDLKSGFDIYGHYGPVLNMKVHKGYLYVCGKMVQTYHEWPTNRIVRWDGSRWCRAKGEFNGPIADFTFLNDTLFVGGLFTQNGADTLKYFAKWVGSLDSLFEHCMPPVEQTIADSYVGEDEPESNQPTALRIYPNPAKDMVFVECPSNDAICRVYSTDGRYLSTIKLKKGTNPVAIKEFGQGLLLLSIQSEGEIYGFKVVVE